MAEKMRYNKIIDLLEHGKPVFSTSTVPNGSLDDLTYIADADYDAVIIEMEHKGFSFTTLRTSLQVLLNRKRIAEKGRSGLPKFPETTRALCACMKTRGCRVPGLWRNGLHLENAIMLFRRLGVDVQLLTAHEFTRAYFQLAKRYHPDRGYPNAHELMAHINAARSAIMKAHSFDGDELTHG
jgi:hypothetical protein